MLGEKTDAYLCACKREFPEFLPSCQEFPRLMARQAHGGNVNRERICLPLAQSEEKPKTPARVQQKPILGRENIGEKHGAETRGSAPLIMHCFAGSSCWSLPK
jgi:hypothetical protein